MMRARLYILLQPIINEIYKTFTAALELSKLVKYGKKGSNTGDSGGLSIFESMSSL